jgi:pimeloyl-ACP methyl ester carboxylesterase
MSRSYAALPDPKIFESRVFPDGNNASLNALLLEHADGEDRYWILFCLPAGASTQVRDVQDQLKRLWTLGYDVFAFDYRGFGASTGTPTEQGLYDDATAAYRYLIRTERALSDANHSRRPFAWFRGCRGSRNETAGCRTAFVRAN